MSKLQEIRYIIIKVLLPLFCFHLPVFSQTSALTELARSHLIEEASGISEGFNSIFELVVTDSYQTRFNQVTHIYFIQSFLGIEIEGSESAVHIDSKGKIIHSYANLISETHFQPDIPEEFLKPNDAISKVAVLMGYPKEAKISLLKDYKQKNLKSEYHFQTRPDSPVYTRLLYQKNETESYVLCWEILMEESNGHKWWNVRIHAGNGNLIDKFPITIECHPAKSTVNFNHRLKNLKENYSLNLNQSEKNYRVFALPKESPLEGARSLESIPWNSAPNASPYGWHDTDGISGPEYTITRGNNVYASEDRNGDFLHGTSPNGGDSLIFDYVIDLDSFPDYYTDASITNLFYWNNLMHDILYQYGFDESSGNFQANNYGKGGEGGDHVDAFCQQGIGLNNAAFTTFPDGKSPRMQMLEYEVREIRFQINSPSEISGEYFATSATFGPKTSMVNGEIHISDPHDGCNPLGNEAELLNRIAMIDRGQCFFIEKTLAAQNAGALAVIICNNEPGNPITMNLGGDVDPELINIPSIMLSDSDCQLIKSHLPDIDATIHLIKIPNYDSSLDNGVIIHEYAHGLSTRLTGGPSTAGCLNNDEQMGEGWSDWVAKVITINEEDLPSEKQEIGSFLLGAESDEAGFRMFPYTTAMSMNPHTYDDIKTSIVPHGVGSVWAAMLWEMTWKLIDKYGFDPDIYLGSGGNNMALQLVIDGMKLQPCRPGFVEARDAILKADSLLTNGENSCLIWESFAKRGLGFSASQGSRFDHTDGSEAFDMPAECPVNCQENLVLEVIDQSVFWAGQSITATGNAGLFPVKLLAGQEIRLDPGFQTKTGHPLEVSILPCPSNSFIKNSPFRNLDPDLKLETRSFQNRSQR